METTATEIKNSSAIEPTTVEQQFVTLTREKRNASRKLEVIQEALTAIESSLIEQLHRNGHQSINLRDGSTVYIRRDLRVSPKKTSAEFVEMLAMDGFFNLLMPSSSRIRAYVKEILTDPNTDQWELSRFKGTDDEPRADEAVVLGAVDCSEVERVGVRGA